MSDERLGLTEAVSMALGGMIGGGIYAVMGVVAGITTYATWAAFVLAGVVALAAGYSYNALNRLSDSNGGSVTFVQCFTGNTTLAGMTGWTLLVGYIGSMAMYAFAFGEFAVAFEAVPAEVVGLPARPLLSVLAVAGFVGLNVLGARTTGTVENVLVAAKVAILLAFGVLGLAYAFGYGGSGTLQFGVGHLTQFGPIVAAAISFVAFQGWQLLFYDQDSISDPVTTIRRAVYVAIPVAVLIYVLVGVVTVNLVPGALQTHPHVALKDAASLMLRPYGLAALGGTVLALSALFSTGSAINATLFSAAHFAKGMLSDDLLPDRIGSADADGVPARVVVLIGAVTAAFTAVGGLGAITSFASLSFMIVFGAMSYLAFRHRDQEAVNPVPPLVGVVGAAGFFPLMLWNLANREPNTFYMVVVIAVLVVTVELLYFERDDIAAEVVPFEEVPVGNSSG
ncbi:APC family permease [Halorientalis regularis]|uniref:Amino acid transporter n=1 Tax=Halorientalis regularis TaxID=660518 RepID=A0A1G7J117_9EURY|nr:APC family permease [Halorientalis regularis]SDF18219.1 Amino acid transporter [Halorientalis regularis]